jgi:small subunit ribosomal protein S6
MPTEACFRQSGQKLMMIVIPDRACTPLLSVLNPTFCAGCGSARDDEHIALLAAITHKENSVSLYECVFIARNDVTQQQVEGIADNIASQLETEGGAMKKREYWGLRSLAYRIKKNRKGHYMLLGLDAKSAFIGEMERQLSLNEDVLRFMTLRVEAIEEGQSAILLRKSDDNERNFRGPKPSGRFDSGRRRSFDNREEFRARDDLQPDLQVDAVE